MTYRLFHIGIRPEGYVDWGRVEKTLDDAGEWLRLNEFNWYVWTTERAAILNQRLQPLIGPKGSILILQIDTSADSDRWGFAPRAVWDWITDKREKALLGA
jgi:hypothetical protein